MKTYKMHFVHLFSLLLLGVGRVEAAEYHVSLKGDPAGDGSYAKPFKMISGAALVAQPGDVITVHAGVYLERIDPPCGGDPKRSASSIRPHLVKRSSSRVAARVGQFYRWAEE